MGIAQTGTGDVNHQHPLLTMFSMNRFLTLGLLAVLTTALLAGCKIPKPPRVPGPIQPPSPPGTGLLPH
jgi:hypothetical protein